MLNISNEHHALTHRLHTLQVRKNHLYPSSVEAIEISNRIKAVKSALEVLDDLQRPVDVRMI
jgi:hypothetical protein